MAVRICDSVGFLVVLSRSAAWIIIPFWQYPQCGTCTSIHACCNGCSAGDAADVPRCCAYSAGNPSSVVIALPLTAATGVTQLLISLPSRSTEHAPHCASPQPNRGPCKCSSLCSTYSNGVSSDAVTECTRPLTLIFNLLAIPPSVRKSVPQRVVEEEGASDHPRAAPPTLRDA